MVPFTSCSNSHPGTCVDGIDYLDHLSATPTVQNSTLLHINILLFPLSLSLSTAGIAQLNIHSIFLRPPHLAMGMLSEVDWLFFSVSSPPQCAPTPVSCTCWLVSSSSLLAWHCRKWTAQSEFVAPQSHNAINSNSDRDRDREQCEQQRQFTLGGREGFAFSLFLSHSHSHSHSAFSDQSWIHIHHIHHSLSSTSCCIPHRIYSAFISTLHWHYNLFDDHFIAAKQYTPTHSHTTQTTYTVVSIADHNRHIKT